MYEYIIVSKSGAASIIAGSDPAPESTYQLIFDAACVPLPSARRPDVEPVEVVRNGPKRLALAAPFGHQCQNLGGRTAGAMRRQRQSSRRLDARVSEPGSPALGLGQRRLGPLRNHLALVLGDGRQDVNGQPVGLGHVAGHEIDAALHQVCDEGHVAGQTVQTGDQKHGTALAALFQGGEELRPVRVPASALDLGEFGGQLTAVDLAGDSLALRVEAEAASALAVGGDAVVGDETGQGSGHVQILNVGLDLYISSALIFSTAHAVAWLVTRHGYLTKVIYSTEISLDFC